MPTSSCTLRSAFALLVVPALLSLFGCGAEGLDTDPAEDEELAEDSAPLITVMTSTAAAGTLHSTNGAKVISGRYGILHGVYAEGGSIKYISSSDGVTWTTPVVLASVSTSRPVIAEDSAGTLGVVYRKNGTLYYVKKPLLSTWSAPINVTSDFASQTLVTDGPSMVAYGTTMHIAWSYGDYIFYAALPASATTPAASSELVNLTTLCATYSTAFPSIAVTPTSSANTAPLVRIGYFETEYPDFSCGGGIKFGTFVSERVSSAFWNILVGGTSTVSSATPVALSLASISATGDFYLACSTVINGVESTSLLHQNAWTAAGWSSTSLLPRQSVVDVSTAYRNCAPFFRVALSDYTMGASSFGPTWYRSGQWTGVAAAPTWTEPSTVSVNTSGRNAEALFWEKSFGPFLSGYTRRIPAAYEQLVGASTSIVNETTTSSGWAPLKACAKINPSLQTARCVQVHRGTGGKVMDAQIASDKSAQNFGQGAKATAGQVNGALRNTLVLFDVSDIPKDATITSAAVTLHRGVYGPGQVDVHQVTAPWDESSVTWASFGGGYVKQGLASFDSGPSGAAGPVSFDVTSLAQAWVTGKAANYGVLLDQPNGGLTSFSTSEAAPPDAEPKLDICFAQ